MNNDPASLKHLHDIVLPSPVSVWPPDTGGLLLLGGLVLCAMLIGFQYYLKYRHNRYRRAGLELLNSAATAQDVLVILKRVALVAFPRERVASLYGNAWVEFLNETCSRTDFQPQFFERLEEPPQAGLLKSAHLWVAGHHPALTKTNDR